MISDNRLARLADRIEIEDVIVRVTRGMDRHDFDLARSAFHEDALDDHGVFIGTAADFLRWAEDLHDATLRGHQHYISNFSVEIDGDEAHAETYVLVAGTQKGGFTTVLGGGRYHDRLERRNGEWKIAARVLTVEWWGDENVAQSNAAISHPYSQDRTDPSYSRPLKVTREFRDLAKNANIY